MGCGASSASKACADQELEAALARFTTEQVEGSQEKLGLGTNNKEFDTIKSFTWSFGGSGVVRIGRVQDVTLNKTPKIDLEIEECTGVFRCDNLANGKVVIKKANILYMHDTCESTVQVDECNCLIILKDGNKTEYRVGSGRVVAVDHGNITLCKGPGVELLCYQAQSEGLVQGEEAVQEFTSARHQGGATIRDI